MNTLRRESSSARALTLKTVALAAAIGASSVAMAAENGNQRYSPGVGGSDMTSPVVPGWYGQVAMVAYHANKMKGNDGNQLVQSGLAVSASDPANPLGTDITYRAPIEASVDTRAALTRLTFISAHQVLGGNLGFTAMLPLVSRDINLSSPGVAITPSLAQSIAGPAVQNRIAGTSSNVTAFGDLEISPVIHWEIGDHQSASFAPTLVLPTGDYDVNRRANSGFGDYYTFRPSVQYAFIGDGWDLGARAVLSFNTKNKENGYRTGNIFNVDFQFMKFVSEDVRVGLQGYAVKQFTKDSSDNAATAESIAQANGNKMQVFAAGPAVAWLKNGGEFLLEGKFLQEFNAKNRTEGQAFWLTLSKPL